MSLKIHSLNVRGLQNVMKRKTIFEWLKVKYNGICFLQETHSTEKVETSWSKEWGGTIFYSHGSSNSAGVAILISPQLSDTITINGFNSVIDGRIIVLDVTVQGKNMILINVYAPTKDKAKEQLELLNTLEVIVSEYADKSILIGGDMNVCLEPELDSSAKQSKSCNYAIGMKVFLETYDLNDTWRLTYPDSRRYTWRNRSKHGFCQSRLDYFFCSNHLLYSFSKITIDASIKTDHSIISIELNLHNESMKKGPGFWKLNTNLLRDPEYVKRIKSTIQESKIKYNSMEDKALKWDIIKCDIRTETISYATWKNKTTRAREKELSECMNNLEIQMQTDNSKYDEYQEKKHELEHIKEEKTKGVIIRSRAQHIEENEKCTKYFCQLEKRNYLKRNITALVTQEDKTVTGTKEILKEELNFYQKLYSKQELRKCDETCSLFQTDITQIADDDKLELDKRLTIEECAIALKDLANNKAPGTDGLPTEFYKYFWIDIKQIVYDSFITSQKNSTLSLDQRRGILTLLPKKDKDIRYLKNWRPLTLLNTDYKILTKSLANRLQSIMDKIIKNDQVGYIKGRQLSFNCRKILDIFESLESETDTGYALFLDFQKAFDTISRDFMIKTLEKFNLGETFINWIKMIYNKPLTCVTNNGYASEFFETERGIRQGCPVSALLFVIVAEILAINIRNNKDIHGLKINDYNIVITQMADDTSIFVKDQNSIKQVLDTLHHFGNCAGLKLNTEKTEAIKLGQSKQLQQTKTFGLRWTQGPIKVTGIYVGKKLEENEEKTLNEKFVQMKSTLTIWKSRNLTIKGKITLLRAKIIPIFLYVASIYPISDSFLKQVEALMFDFIWPNKKHHVKKNVLIKDIESGGLKMPDLESIVKSVKMNWIKLTQTNNDLKEYIENITNVKSLHSFLSYKFDIIYITKNLPLFYKQIFQFWFELHSRPPENVNEIMNEIVWNNKYILIGNKPIPKKMWCGNENITIYDLLDTERNIQSKSGLEQKFNIEIDQMFYNSLISAIPRNWKKQIKSNSNVKFVKSNPLCIKLENKLTLLTKEIRCKTVCTEYIKIKTKDVHTPATHKWEELYPDYHFDWREIYCLPYKICRETKLQSFQYQVINRYIACNYSLFKWGKADSPLCADCNTIEDIEHLFFRCHNVNSFWIAFKVFWQKCYQFTVEVKMEDILFGMSNGMDLPEIYALNFCILMAKKFIYECNIDGKAPIFKHYLFRLKNRLIVEKLISIKNEHLSKFNERYEPIEIILSRNATKGSIQP